ncbi:hypothetical protein EV385_3621 [Krasilnikovia cinnamomea]|uniref:Uncharacterized protein n=2 Tax=Krasilnikovia cinnamomea TaxID=349313 RepID=A0A4V2G7A8_9ACTN|nr:hypothetical protein EV385_3621 [Krasilnikovia cinnamomea]
MNVAGVFLWLGLFPGVVAALSAAIAAGSVRRSRRLRRAVPVTCRDLADMRKPPKKVIVAGRVNAGPGGLLTGPVTMRPCLWWQVDVYSTREYRDNTVTRQRTVHDLRRSGNAVELADDTGSVLLDGDVFGKVIVAAEDSDSSWGVTTQDMVEEGKRRHRLLLGRLRDADICDFVENRPLEFTVFEKRLEPERKVTVLATPVRHEQGWRLAAWRGDGAIVHDLAQLRADADKEARKNARFAVVFTKVTAVVLGIAGIAQVVQFYT